jgi:histidyl-tRNA synthetase
LDALNLFPETVTESTKVLFINFGEKEAMHCLELIQALRAENIKTELYPEAAKMKKQMTFANKRAIPYVVLVGEAEIQTQTYTIKHMVSGEQQQLSKSQLIELLK